MAAPLEHVPCTVWRRQRAAAGTRAVPEETAIVFTYNGGSYAVMMATPQDLEDFAYGFSLTEGLVETIDEIESLEIIEGDLGIELRMRLADPRGRAYSERRRHLAGPTGCGLCGIESLEEVMRSPPPVASAAAFCSEDIMQAIDGLGSGQRLNRQTRAMHGAALWLPAQGLVTVREDVGRHNALDKLAGVIAQRRIDPRGGGVIFTSRVSVEMIQKTAAMGVPLAIAVSAPTALAVRMAENAGITLVAVARGDGFEVFTHAYRVRERSAAHVA